MSSAQHLQTMTADEFLALPESTLPHELIEGVLYMAPAPELNHQDVKGDVFIFLKSLKSGKVYDQPTDVRLDDETVVQPDVLWLPSGSAAKMATGKYLIGAPNLVVEVLSTGTNRHDRGEKYVLYEQHGVAEYWLIDPSERFLERFVRQDRRFVRVGLFGVEHTFHSPTLKIEVPVAAFFVSIDEPK